MHEHKSWIFKEPMQLKKYMFIYGILYYQILKKKGPAYI